MAVKNSKTAADGATEGAVTDSTTNQAGADTAAATSQPDISTSDTAAAAPDPQAAELIAGEWGQAPVMLHPDSLAQLADLLSARLAPVVAPAPAANTAPVDIPALVEVVQPTSSRVACRALRPIEHDGVLYGPGSPAGDVFDVAKAGLAQLKSVHAVEDVSDEASADPGEAGKKEA